MACHGGWVMVLSGQFWRDGVCSGMACRGAAVKAGYVRFGYGRFGSDMAVLVRCGEVS